MLHLRIVSLAVLLAAQPCGADHRMQYDIASGPCRSPTLVDLMTDQNHVGSYTVQTADDLGRSAKKHLPELL